MDGRAGRNDGQTDARPRIMQRASSIRRNRTTATRFQEVRSAEATTETPAVKSV